MNYESRVMATANDIKTNATQAIIHPPRQAEGETDNS